MLPTQGGRFNGWGLYVLEGRPVFSYNLMGVKRTRIAAPDKLTPGKHAIRVDFKYDGGLGGGGTAAVLVDRQKVAEGKLDRTIPFRISASAKRLDIGEDTGTSGRARTTTSRSNSPANLSRSGSDSATKTRSEGQSRWGRRRIEPLGVADCGTESIELPWVTCRRRGICSCR